MENHILSTLTEMATDLAEELETAEETFGKTDLRTLLIKAALSTIRNAVSTIQTLAEILKNH